MPANFDKCVKNGGRVRTKSLDGGKYMHVCFKDGKSYAGEVKKKENLRWTSDIILENDEISLDEMMHGKDHITADGGAGKSMKGKKMHGTLIKHGESRNGRFYEYDGIIKAMNRAELPIPVSMNHSEDVTDNVALITKLLPTGDGLDYEGIVYNTSKHSGVIEMMEKGLINKISIEGDNPIMANEGNKIIVKEFQLMGAGFVKYAGIPQATASIAEALEKNNEIEEVEDMDDVAELKSRLEAKEKELDDIRLAEADKKRIEEEAKKKHVEETIATLQSEVKTLKETRSSGVITEQGSESPYKIVERVPIKSIKNPEHIPAKSFVMENRNSEKARFFPLDPAEFY